MYLLILFFPLLSFLISGMFGFFFGRLGATYISVILLGLSFCFSLFIFYEVGLCNIFVNIDLFNWFILDIFIIKFGLLFDSLTATMLIIITSISFFVHLYSLEYMGHDPYLNRFIAYLSLFTFFMLILITSDNFLQLFIGWEGVGLCSYLLINFWFTRMLANKAALKAMIVNRIADVFFIIAIIYLLFYCGTTDYLIIFSLLANFIDMTFAVLTININFINIISFFLFCGAIGKSAQLGLHTWLPDAMEGPTPVSALLHAATMVTAGVFLIIRCSPILEYSDFMLFIIAIFGGLTAFFFSFSAIFQFDIKKVIAYSTCSQLGYMFLACGLSFYNVALFHLFNHAFFKALLFLSAGSIIHALEDEQDMRRMGGLVNFLPFTFFCMFFGSLAIMGFPFLTGFYSKDLILELLISSYKIDFLFLYILALIAAFFTAFYSIRLLLLVFFFKPNMFSIFFPKESSFFIFFSLFFLTLASLGFGYLFADLFVGSGTFFWDNSLLRLPLNSLPIDINLLSPFVRNLPLFISLVGCFAGFLLIKILQNLNFSSALFFLETWYIYNHICSFIVNKFFYNAGYFNIIYNELSIILYNFSYTTNTKLIDKGILELFGPIGLYKYFYKWSRLLWRIPTSLFINIGFIFFSFICLYLYSLIMIFELNFYLFNYEILPIMFMILMTFEKK